MLKFAYLLLMEINKSFIIYFFSFLFLNKDWIQISKGLKESFNQSYNERACPVQEYHAVSQSDRSSLHSSASSLSSEPINCSVLLPADESCLSSPCSSTSSTSSTTTVLVSSEEAEQVSV